jgi:type I restriction enzyme S subunit
VGGIPRSWTVSPFKDVFSVDTKNGLYKQKSFYGSGPKMVHMGEMFKARTIEEIDIESSVKVNEKELEAFGLKDGDLLFARRSLVPEGAGLCCIYKGSELSTTFESSIIRVRLNSKTANPDYFNYFFRSRFGRWLMERIIQTVAASGIKGTDLKNMLVPIPPKDEQDEIVELLDALTALQEATFSASAERNQLLKSLIGKTVSVGCE